MALARYWFPPRVEETLFLRLQLARCTLASGQIARRCPGEAFPPGSLIRTREPIRSVELADFRENGTV